MSGHLKFKGSYLSYLLMYFFYYISMALFSGLISVYLMGQGYTASQVSMVVSCSMVFSLLSQPVIGRFFDRGSQKTVFAVLMIAAAALAIVFPFLKNIWIIAVVYSLVLACVNGANPVLEKMATTSRFRYGQIRIWGTIGYATGSQISGILYDFLSPASMYYFFGVGILICLLGIAGTSSAAESKTEKQEKIPFKVTGEFLTYLILAGMFAGMTNVHNTYLPSILNEEGMAVSTVSTILFCATMLEFPVVFFGGRIINRMKNKGLLYVLFGILVFQFAVLAFIPVLPAQIAVIILTKSFVTMANIMINLRIVASIVDEKNQITALALVASVRSLVGIFFQTAGAEILDRFGGSIFYAVLAAVALLAILITKLSGIRNTRSEIFS